MFLSEFEYEKAHSHCYDWLKIRSNTGVSNGGTEYNLMGFAFSPPVFFLFLN